MPKSNLRSKMVTFRVSPEEYRSLQEACAAHGARNVSELVRAATYTLVGADAPAGRSFENRIRALRDRIESISSEVERLARDARPRVAEAGTQG